MLAGDDVVEIPELWSLDMLVRGMVERSPEELCAGEALANHDALITGRARQDSHHKLREPTGLTEARQSHCSIRHN